MPIKTYAAAINEALDQCMTEDKNVLIVGEGVPDGIFGSTKGLQEKFSNQVFDSPIAESSTTGVVVGLAISGLRPVHVHQRCDFLTISADQLISNSAKWFSIFGKPCPLVVLATIGRGWGNGQTHTQNFSAMFAAIPGLKVISPTTARDIKGMMISAIRDNNPVIVLCHRWLYNLESEVPLEMYETEFKANVVKQGSDVTLVGISYTTLDCVKAAEYLQEHYNIEAEVIDLRTIAPLDIETIEISVKKTGKLIATDTAHKTGSIAECLVSRIVESCFYDLLKPPVVLGSKNYPQPTSHFLTEDYYVRYGDIVNEVLKMYGIKEEIFVYEGEHDVPHKNYSITF